MMVKQLEAEQEEKIPERPEKELADAFKIIDSKLDSKIDWDELKAALTATGEQFEVKTSPLLTKIYFFFRTGKLTRSCEMETKTLTGLLTTMNSSIWWNQFPNLSEKLHVPFFSKPETDNSPHHTIFPKFCSAAF